MPLIEERQRRIGIQPEYLIIRVKRTIRYNYIRIVEPEKAKLKTKKLKLNQNQTII
mgnify:CR=1 FL=1